MVVLAIGVRGVALLLVRRVLSLGSACRGVVGRVGKLLVRFGKLLVSCWEAVGKRW